MHKYRIIVQFLESPPPLAGVFLFVWIKKVIGTTKKRCYHANVHLYSLCSRGVVTPPPYRACAALQTGLYRLQAIGSADDVGSGLNIGNRGCVKVCTQFSYHIALLYAG